MKRTLLQKLKEERGSETVEFVILIPALMLFLAFALTITQLLYGSSVAFDAANTGGRTAIIQDNRRDAESKAITASQLFLSDCGMGVTFKECKLEVGGSWKRENICTCCVTVNIKTILPIGFQKNYEITRSCPMMIERGEKR